VHQPIEAAEPETRQRPALSIKKKKARSAFRYPDSKKLEASGKTQGNQGEKEQGQLINELGRRVHYQDMND